MTPTPDMARPVRDPRRGDAPPGAMKPEQFGAHVRSEVAKYAKIIQRIGLKAD